MLSCWLLQEATAANKELLELPDGWEPDDTRNILAIVSAELGCEHEATRLAALHWMTTLLSRSHSTVSFPQHLHLISPLQSGASLEDLLSSSVDSANTWI